MLAHRSHLSVDWQSPINWGDSLNRGLRARWIVAPHLSGGTRWHELVGGNHGTLTSMDPPNDWVTSGSALDAGKREMWGCLDFDGSNDYVINSGFSINGFSQASLSCWAKIATGQSHNYLVEIPNSSAGSNGMDLFLNGTTTIRAYLYTTSGNSISATYSYAGAGWIHLVNTYDGATHRLYINGVQQASMARSGAISAPANEINFGRFGSAGLHAACQIADVSVYNRGLNDGEVAALYADQLDYSRRTLRRWSRRFFALGAGSVTGSPWYYYAQQALLSGAAS